MHKLPDGCSEQLRLQQGVDQQIRHSVVTLKQSNHKISESESRQVFNRGIVKSLKAGCFNNISYTVMFDCGFQLISSKLEDIVST
jgi:hypothetical protein